MQHNESSPNRSPSVVVACLMLLGSCPGGCPFEGPPPGENYLSDAITFAFIVGSGLRGSSTHRCSSEGVGCSIFAPVGCGTCEDATIVPELSPLVVVALGEEDGEARQSAGGPRAVVVGDSAAEIVDLATATLVQKIDLSGSGVRVAVSDDGRYAAVRLGGGAGVDILDLARLELVDTATFSSACAARGLSFLPGTHDVFVACQDEGSLQRFSVTDGQAGAPVEVVSGCEGARGVAFTADGQRGVFTCSQSLWIYDVPTDSVAWNISGFTNVTHVTVRLDGTRAYVNDRLDSGGYRLVTVDLATFDHLAETPLDGFPSGLFLSDGDRVVYSLTGNRLYVADAAGEIQGSASTPVFALGGFTAALPATE